MDELREAFNEAWDEDESNREGEEAETEAEGTESLAEETPEASADEGVSDDQETEQSTVADDEKGDNEAGSEKEPESEKAGDDKGSSVAEKAPASWTPAARENWAKIPAAAQAQIAKREQQMTDHMQNTAGATKAIKQFKAVMEPYQSSMMAAGVKDPYKVIDTLMYNDNVLRHGQTQDKAKLIASMIDRFNVDIGELDGILTNQPATAQPQQNGQMQDMINQAMAPVNQMLEQQNIQQQNNAYQEQQTATNDVAEFAKGREFYDDVRNDMADFMDMANKQGREMTLPQAYDKACALNPEISGIMSERSQQETILGGNNLAQNKRNAASSITGSRGGLNSSGGANASIRDTIANAWDESYG